MVHDFPSTPLVKKRKREDSGKTPVCPGRAGELSTTLKKYCLHPPVAPPSPEEFEPVERTNVKIRFPGQEATYNLRRLVHAYGGQAQYYFEGLGVLSNYHHETLVKVS